MNLQLLLSSLFTLVIFPKCISASMATSNDIDTSNNNTTLSSFDVEESQSSNSGDSTSYLMWHLLPFAVRKELIKVIIKPEYVSNVPVANAITTQISPEEVKPIIMPDEILAQVHCEDDWFDVVKTYVENFNYDIKTRYYAIIELLKNATPKTISTIYNNRKEFEEFHYDTMGLRSIIVELITESRSSGKDIISILKIFEYNFNERFNLITAENLKMIRKAAFKLDDCELMAFTDQFPDIIKPSSTDQKEFVDLALHEDHIPKLWNMICSKASPDSSCQQRSSDLFVKFKLFDKPVNTKNWSAAMWAIASQNFELVQNIPGQLLKNEDGTLPTSVDGSSTFEQMVQMIPDAVYQENIRKKCKNDHGIIIPAGKLTSFRSKKANGEFEGVQVLETKEQCGKAKTPILRKQNLDTVQFLNQYYGWF